METLGDFKDKCDRDEKKYAEVFRKKHANKHKDPEFEKVNRARRIHAHHFYNVKALKDTDVLNYKLVKIVAPYYQMRILLRVTEPLDNEWNDICHNKHDDETYEYFRKLYSEELQNDLL